MSEREGVGSLEMIKVFFPCWEKWRAIAEAQVVFPTPPFPPIIIKRFSSLSRRFNGGAKITPKGIDISTGPDPSFQDRAKWPLPTGAEQPQQSKVEWLILNILDFIINCFVGQDITF